jgi:aminoglycoside phosphotransferase (APT) family kinase protein
MDTRRIEAEWEAALMAPPWAHQPVWIHGDLDARNLLATDGRLSGVLDFGALAVGDPAAEVMVAWKMLRADVRASFREILGVDDATWSRARGWVLSQAVMILSYYTLETNRILVREAEGWIGELLDDPI